MIKLFVFLFCWLLGIISYILCFLPSLFLSAIVTLFSDPTDFPWVGGTPVSHYHNWRKGWRYTYIKIHDHIKNEFSC